MQGHDFCFVSSSMTLLEAWGFCLPDSSCLPGLFRVETRTGIGSIGVLTIGVTESCTKERSHNLLHCALSLLAFPQRGYPLRPTAIKKILKLLAPFSWQARDPDRQIDRQQGERGKEMTKRRYRMAVMTGCIRHLSSSCDESPRSTCIHSRIPQRQPRD